MLSWWSVWYTRTSLIRGPAHKRESRIRLARRLIRWNAAGFERHPYVFASLSFQLNPDTTPELIQHVLQNGESER